MKKLLLKNSLSPGDILMLTAAVRDLHRCYPNQFLTGVETNSSELWENNPLITTFDKGDLEIETINCYYPLVHQSNRTPYHFIHGFIEHLNSYLGLQIKPTEFKGDIYLSPTERSLPSPVEELYGLQSPYWIIVAGGKRNYTIKWWETKRYQEVVEHFRGRIQFVQVGAAGHFHMGLKDVLDLRGKTNIRQLIRLVYHSDGVVCPVTFLMHLAAAVDHKPLKGLRPCVVIAGGREPPHWEAYPGHQFLHTIGMLPCCSNGGCWRSRTLPLKDRSEHDCPENLCVDVVGNLPRCMDMITSSDVIRRIEMYLEGAEAYKKQPDSVQANKRPDSLELHAKSARAISEAFIETITPYPSTFAGKGIVICGGGIQYYTNAWICINMLRHFGCRLPIQLWYLGEQEMDSHMIDWLLPLNVECIDGLKVREKLPTRLMSGWILKPYAIINSPFKEVLFLDADNVPIVSPDFLFETPEYLETGAIFWPDLGRLEPTRTIWNICGIEYQDEPEFESAQIVVDKEKCWKALSLCMWYNEHSDFFYHYVYGDKETFHMAFRKLDKTYSMPGPLHPLPGVMCHHDFQGRRIFQHRTRAKWELFARNASIEGFLFEDQCKIFLGDLRKKWKASKPHSETLFSQFGSDMD